MGRPLRKNDPRSTRDRIMTDVWPELAVMVLSLDLPLSV